MTEVVAALLWQDEKFLICQRPKEKARGLLWEFAGGKVEPGETKQQALMREIREELGAQIDVGEVFMEVDHIYPDITIHLTLFHARLCPGEQLHRLEHNDLRFITAHEIPQFEFCPADAVILERLTAEYGS